MTARFEAALNKLSPEQVDALLAQAESMAQQPRPRGRKLLLDWAGSIDSEHESGLEAQRAAMDDWTRAIEKCK